MPRPRPRVVTLALFVAALAVRLVNLEILETNPYYEAPIMDEQYHHVWASDIVQGRAGEYLPFYRAPGYPYLLAAAYAATEPRVHAGRVLSSVLGAATVPVAFLMGIQVAGLVPALIGAVALIFLPIALYFDGMLLGTSLETLMFASSLLLLLSVLQATGRVKLLVLSVALGLLIGLATITRPLLAIILPVAVAFLVVRRTRNHIPGGGGEPSQRSWAGRFPSLGSRSPTAGWATTW